MSSPCPAKSKHSYKRHTHSNVEQTAAAPYAFLRALGTNAGGPKTTVRMYSSSIPSQHNPLGAEMHVVIASTNDLLSQFERAFIRTVLEHRGILREPSEAELRSAFAALRNYDEQCAVSPGGTAR